MESSPKDCFLQKDPKNVISTFQALEDAGVIPEEPTENDVETAKQILGEITCGRTGCTLGLKPYLKYNTSAGDYSNINDALAQAAPDCPVRQQFHMPTQPELEP